MEALAAYACDPRHTRGRRFCEPMAPTRTEFQRDRDRIVHSTAFRRLVYKTQVFLNHEGDLFRTRLTHSLEVAQLGRSIARSLRLNEDLVEAIALAHDLGHTPFGHAGQDALHECMQPFGGFEHNLQSLRVVDQLEERYPAFDGLNLTFESREGILKHCSRTDAQALELREPEYGDAGGGVGRRFLNRQQPSLEAQLCNLSDEIAYNAHDIDDGVRSGLIQMGQVLEVPLVARFYQEAVVACPPLAKAENSRRCLYDTIRRMLSAQVYDVIDATRNAIAYHAPASVADVRGMPPLVQFSEPMREASKALKAFLFQSLYRHPEVMRTMNTAQQVVRELFAFYVQSPREMQAGYASKVGASANGTGDCAERITADYIAGMTDRFASHEHARLTGRNVWACVTHA